jgi:ABC-2 type transport system ATP-binding protein
LLRRIGVQLQASAFFERLTAREQLSTFAALYGVPDSRVGDVLELVGLTEQGDTLTDRLSGGHMQRLSIACSLVHDPELVFLDEPSSGLDPQARRNLWDLLRSINQDGRTVMLTTHYLDEAETLCDRVAIMDHGRILAIDTPAGFIHRLEAATHISVEPSVVTAEDAAELPGVDGVTDDQDTVRGDGAAAALVPMAVMLGFAVVIGLVATRFFQCEAD